MDLNLISKLSPMHTRSHVQANARQLSECPHPASSHVRYHTKQFKWFRLKRLVSRIGPGVHMKIPYILKVHQSASPSCPPLPSAVGSASVLSTLKPTSCI